MGERERIDKRKSLPICCCHDIWNNKRPTVNNCQMNREFLESYEQLLRVDDSVERIP